MRIRPLGPLEVGDGDECLVGRAEAMARLGDPAALPAADAVDTARDAGYGPLEAQAAMASARAHLARRDVEAAHEAAETVLRLARATGHRLGEARTLRLPADIAMQEENPSTTADCRERATVLLAEMVIPETG